VPVFDFGHRMAIAVAAPPARVAAAAESYRVDRDGSPLTRLLVRLRGLTPGHGTLRAALERGGFAVLAEAPDEEIVFGVAGRFWALDEAGAMVRLAGADEFTAFARPGFAKAAMNLRFEPRPGDTTCLSTETRVACVDAGAYWRFAPYWMVIRPFSQLIRCAMLRAIARRSRP
jgi:hypothetical protein